jgi:hypothetical protein
MEFEIDINNDELLKTIWEGTRAIKAQGRSEKKKRQGQCKYSETILTNPS